LGGSDDEGPAGIINARQVEITRESRFNDSGPKNPVIAAEFPAMGSPGVEHVICCLDLRGLVMLGKSVIHVTYRFPHHNLAIAKRSGVARWKDLGVSWILRTCSCVDIGVVSSRLAARSESELVHQPWREYLCHTESERVCIDAIVLAV